ncbi:GntR family transcriptional regulator [Pseudonocardia acaciae]|uniref:GntR family transcriptional regulator n=1 Tax=Pseudonocardia acaciae TaxID=551276 RepID=UPI00048F715F|nr:GntR family transcriptional regulator [Pseudonocardia acaciae]
MPRTRPWVRIAEDLRTAVTSGRLRPGDPLPTARELMDRWGVARQTVQNAIDQLRTEGLVGSRPGRGWYVAERPAIRRLARNRLSKAERDAGRGAFLSDAAQGGWRPDVSVEVRRQPADDRIAGILDLAGDVAEVVVRAREMRADGRVVQLATSYFPAGIAAGTAIEQPDTGDGGVYERLEELGFRLTHFEEAVNARPARPEEASGLGIPAGYPVLAVTRVAWAGDRAVEVNDMVLAGDRYELVYTLPAD